MSIFPTRAILLWFPSIAHTLRSSTCTIAKPASHIFTHAKKVTQVKNAFQYPGIIIAIAANGYPTISI